MKKFLMILASTGLCAALSAPMAFADPAPAAQKAGCTGQDCKTAAKDAHHGTAAHKAGNHAGKPAAAKHTAAPKDKDCKDGKACPKH